MELIEFTIKTLIAVFIVATFGVFTLMLFAPISLSVVLALYTSIKVGTAKDPVALSTAFKDFKSGLWDGLNTSSENIMKCSEEIDGIISKLDGGTPAKKIPEIKNYTVKEKSFIKMKQSGLDDGDKISLGNVSVVHEYHITERKNVPYNF